MAWPEITVTSWKSFAAWMSNITGGTPPASAYAFRGQSNSADALRPSLLRTFSGLDRAAAVAIESVLLKEFQSSAHLVLPTSQIPHTRDIFSWWTLMQHHGAPTRLLDWTKSPAVAAYFAVEKDLEKDGAIWYFNVNRVQEKTEPPLDEVLVIDEKKLSRYFEVPCELRCCYLLERKQKIERMVTQQAGFTMSPDILADHDEIIERSLVRNDEKEWFGKLVIRAELKPEFLLQLHRLNVNGMALFPGIDGLGRLTKDLATLQARYHKN
jgi:hypothetical protein